MRIIKLGDIADIITGPFGSQLHKEDYVEHGIPVIMPQNIADRRVDENNIAQISERDYQRLKRYATQKYDLVYARRGDVEKHAYIDHNKKALCGTGCLRIRVSDTSVVPLYLSFYLCRPETRKWLVTHAVGSNMPNLNAGILSEVPIELPDYATQVKVAIALQRIEDKVSLNEKVNDNLAQQLRLLYDYWFTQFDFPDENGKPYRSSGGQMVWNNGLKRKIPESWRVVPLGEVSSFRNGINYDKNTSGDTTYHIVNVRNISSSSILLDERELDEICLPCAQAEKYLVSNESILIARSGIPGAPRILYNPSEDIIFCGFIICATPVDSILQPYLMLFLKQLEGSTATQTGGSILKNVSQDTLRDLLVPIPPKDILTHFNQRVALIYEFMHNNLEETSKLQNLRDWLLPMLMNGQATISD